jgi:hypothetical protein
MDSAVAGLIGAGIGAMAGVAGTLITNYSQAKQERLKWLRDKRVESYANTIKYLTRVLNKRSEISIENGFLVTVMGKDITKEWFDDLSEALAWFSSLSIYCSESQEKEINNAFRIFDQFVSKFINGSHPPNFQDDISSILDSIIECARRDIGKAVR